MSSQLFLKATYEFWHRNCYFYRRWRQKITHVEHAKRFDCSTSNGLMVASILHILNCWQAYLRSFLYCFSICVFMHLFDKICNYTSQIAHMLCTFETLFFSILALLPNLVIPHQSCRHTASVSTMPFMLQMCYFIELLVVLSYLSLEKTLSKKTE